MKKLSVKERKRLIKKAHKILDKIDRHLDRAWFKHEKKQKKI